MKKKSKTLLLKILPKRLKNRRSIESVQNSDISFGSLGKINMKPIYKGAKSPSLLNIINNKEVILKNLIKRFKDEFEYTPRVGIELEFYLIPHANKRKSEEGILQDILNECKKQKIKILALERERGEGQFEIKTYPETDLVKLASSIDKIKDIVHKQAVKSGFIADFSAQPFPDDCGSALQINLSFWDKNKKNIFERRQDVKTSEFVETREMLVCIGGVCKYIRESSVLFAQSESDYKRYNVLINRKLHAEGKFTAPVNISWGMDNRTTAIRIPAQKFKTLKNVKINDRDRRIENRVPSAECDPYLAIIGTLRGAYEGLVGGLEPPEKIYGNAYEIEHLERIKFGKELNLDWF